jgi:hypothetical protein
VLIGAASFAACVLPDGLEIKREEVEVNQPPRVISQDPLPYTETLTLPYEASADELRTILLGVSDPNLRDKIYVRMFVDYDEGKSQIHRSAVSNPPMDPSVPRPRIEFAGLSCRGTFGIVDTGGGEMGAGGTGMTTPTKHILELLITDREWDDQSGGPTNRGIAQDAFFVSAVWAFQCQ